MIGELKRLSGDHRGYLGDQLGNAALRMQGLIEEIEQLKDETDGLRAAARHARKMRDAEIERLARELEVQKAVNDLAYIPHRNLVESRDGLQKRFDKVEAERDRLTRELVRWRTEALAWRNGCTGKHGSQAACVDAQKFGEPSPDETGEKRAYYETHDPPHCPTCGCGMPSEMASETIHKGATPLAKIADKLDTAEDLTDCERGCAADALRKLADANVRHVRLRQYRMPARELPDDDEPSENGSGEPT